MSNIRTIEDFFASEEIINNRSFNLPVTTNSNNFTDNIKTTLEDINSLLKLYKNILEKDKNIQLSIVNIINETVSILTQIRSYLYPFVVVQNNGLFLPMLRIISRLDKCGESANLTLQLQENKQLHQLVLENLKSDNENTLHSYENICNCFYNCFIVILTKKIIDEWLMIFSAMGYTTTIKYIDIVNESPKNINKEQYVEWLKISKNANTRIAQKRFQYFKTALVKSTGAQAVIHLLETSKQSCLDAYEPINALTFNEFSMERCGPCKIVNNNVICASERCKCVDNNEKLHIPLKNINITARDSLVENIKCKKTKI